MGAAESSDVRIRNVGTRAGGYRLLICANGSLGRRSMPHVEIRRAEFA